MKITKYPQSAILIEDKGKRVLIDPGKFCYDEDFTPNDWGKINILLITHEHTDHCQPDAIKIIKESNPNIVILTNNSVKNILAAEKIDSEVISPNEEKEIQGFIIRGIKSIHGDLPNGQPKPEVIGFLIDNKIYNPGDTIYLNEKPQADIVFPPICGTVVMNPEEAAEFSKETGAQIAIPVHYDNPVFPVDVNDFAKALGPTAKILNNGEGIEI